MARIRSRHGLAYDDQELAVGLSSVAAPIAMSDGESPDSRSPARCLHTGCTRVAPFVTRAAKGISERLGDTDFHGTERADSEAVTDDMLSRVLRTLSSDDWV